ncbi:hypothetical protein PRUPE_7G036800 [Prunus persica]|uniref:Uncharacterized protein n=1 Tax=Prunus persica TaxID=3760 RepID=A0A251N6C4_PRUPE|nr:hypothetical protein PRUPE_7G036800 [Prunus persica]
MKPLPSPLKPTQTNSTHPTPASHRLHITQPPPQLPKPAASPTDQIALNNQTFWAQSYFSNQKHRLLELEEPKVLGSMTSLSSKS